ncbi:DUF2274 domain-containing protein [Stenotrophomonas sp. AR029]|uniref:DUF2274 domain-containing protein n=1 Tax=Stenotrophomonas sp. AR029 TaxID=3398601 RepID=UPI0039C6F8B0
MIFSHSGGRYGSRIGLKPDLDRYAVFHPQSFGDRVDATTLIPHMLEAFIAGIGNTRNLLSGTDKKSAPL